MRYVPFKKSKSQSELDSDILRELDLTKTDADITANIFNTEPSILSVAIDMTSVAYGTGNIVLSANSFSTGSGNTNSGESSVVFGQNNRSFGDYNYIAGINNSVSGNSISLINSIDNIISGSNISLFGVSGATINGSNTTYIQSVSVLSGANFNEISVARISGDTDNNIVINSPGSIFSASSTNNISIGGGTGSNSILGSNNTIFGSNNSISGTSSAVFLGNSNIIYGNYSSIIGNNNTLNSIFSHSFGGFNNLNGDYSLTFGSLNNLTGNYSLLLGSLNNLTGNYSSIIGISSSINSEHSTTQGSNLLAEDDYSYVGGYKASATTYGEWTRSSDGTYGGQYGFVSYTTGTTNNSQTEIFLTTIQTNKRFVLPVDSIYFVEIVGVASDIGSGDSASFKGEGTIKNTAGTTSLINAITINQIDADASMIPTLILATADNINSSLKIEVQGLEATNINWFVSIKYTRVKI